MQIKAAVVLADEKEAGERAILNFGHSVGHAVELLSQDQGMLHGEAISIGMAAEGALARTYGHLQTSHLNRLEMALKSYKLPIELPAHLRCETVKIVEAMALDKKNKNGAKELVMLSGVGKTLMPLL